MLKWEKDVFGGERMAERSLGTDLTQGHVGKTLLRFSAPFMLANLLQCLYNLVDAVVVGHFVGANGLAAVSGAGELIQIYTFIAIGFGGAGQTLIGQFVGAKDRESIRRTIGNLFVLLLVLALLVSAFCIALMDWQLEAIHLPEESLQGGRDYLLVCALGMIFIFGYNLVSAIMRGMGDSKRPLLFVAVASAVNLVLDLVFVAGLGMDAFGAALATVLGQAISFLWALVYLFRHREAFGFDFRPASFRLHPGILRLLVKLGLPMSVQGALITLSMVYVSAQINVFGVAASAANAIHMKLNSVLRIISNSMSTAGSAMIAQNVGAQRQDRVKQVFRWVFVYTMSYCLLCALAILIFPQQIFSLFNTEAEVLEYAVIFSVIGAFDYIAYALRAPCTATINGTGAATLGLAAGIVDGVIARLGFSILFGHVLGMGVAGYWLGSAVAGYCNVLIGAPYYFSGAWKRKRLLVE